MHLSQLWGRRPLNSSRPHLVFIHSSDELYGADRMLVEMVGAVPSDVGIEVWLPNDLDHPVESMSLCHTLQAGGVCVRHLDLPIMRRAYRTPQGLAALVRRGYLLVWELRRSRPQIVYCTTSAAMLAAPVARLARVPRVIGHLQEIWSATDAALLANPTRACHTLLAISQAVTASLPRDLRERTEVVVNSTPPPDRLVPLEGRTGELRYLIASRWNGWKGHRTLLAAWNQVPPPGRLVVLGGPPRSGDFVDVPALVTALTVPDSVSVVGEVTDPSRYIEESDVVLMPSDQPEPFGLLAIEAFARGRPVIASAAGGLLGIMTPGKDGWLFPVRDVDALADLLAGLTRGAVTTAGAQARETYERRFTSVEFGRRWRQLVLPEHPADASSPT